MPCFSADPAGTKVAVRVVPRASRTKIDGLLDGALKIRLAAPPVDGAANAAARDFLAEAAGLRRSEVVLLSGEKSRNKTFLLRGLPPEQARQKLLG
ncbi:MAG: DUF167 domain-containing protein [Kiritimatiellae bacterium]|nr:DUF167 domain-containing protein [Kiritimatiellia bacterium]